MRRFTLSFLAIVSGIIGPSVMSFSQIHPFIPPIYHQGPGIVADYPCGDNRIGANPDNGYVSGKSVLEDPSAMKTTYDLQANPSIGGQRLYYWPSDNTMAAVATWSQEPSNAFSDRGTGYNYFDGTQWGALPSARVESVRTGWPSVQPYGNNGECILSYQWSAGSGPLVFSKRSSKGTGSWTESYLPNPAGQQGMLWSRMVTSGSDHMSIHVIAITPPTGNGGIPYNGMDGAMLYIHSTDGGATWGEWQQLPGMTSSEYLEFGGDTYDWAQPQGDILCFVVSNELMDTFIMKSNDNGTSWTKTVIYNSPYNLTGTSQNSPGWFYCPDGSSSIALDKNGMAHIIFALGCDTIGNGIQHQRWTNGIVYWNESMPALRQDLDPDSLFKSNQLIGWVTDTMVFHQPSDTKPGGYHGAITGTPTMAIDDNNNLFAAWMSPTTVLDPDGYMFTHIFERTATIYPGNDIYWHDSIIDLTGSDSYTYKECVFPSLSPTTSADRFHLLFQCDDRAGCYVLGMHILCYFGQVSISDNNMVVMSPLKSDVGVGTVKKKVEMPAFSVSEPFPNPCYESTTILANLSKPGHLSLELLNVTGQKIYSEDKGRCLAGNHKFMMDVSHFRQGIYFYSVNLDENRITKKMVVD